MVNFLIPKIKSGEARLNKELIRKLPKRSSKNA
jgi:hypothetical protein